MTWASISVSKGFSTAAQVPTWSARVDRLISTPSRAKRSHCRFSGWCWPNFSNSTIASRLGPAQARGMVWNGAGGWVIVSQARQENVSRTVWITFHWRGMLSSVSVIVSPSLQSLVRPAAGAAAGSRNDDALTRQVVGERLARRLPAGERLDRRGLRGGLFGRQLVLARRRLKFLQLQFHLVQQPRLAFGALAVEVAAQLLDLQLRSRR